MIDFKVESVDKITKGEFYTIISRDIAGITGVPLLDNILDIFEQDGAEEDLQISGSLGTAHNKKPGMVTWECNGYLVEIVFFQDGDTEITYLDQYTDHMVSHDGPNLFLLDFSDLQE